MIFFRVAYKSSIKPTTYPSFSLTTNDWDDYGTECTFYLNFYPKAGEKIGIGGLKILQKGTSKTLIPEKFDTLDDTNNNFISLGQDIEFYENLLENCGRSQAENVLTALCDIAWQPPLAIPFETTSAYRNALFRNNSALKARRFGQAIIQGLPIDERFAFKYRLDIPNATSSFDVNIDLDEKDEIPGRIVSIIGRNAVGKTQFLASLAGDLVQLAKNTSKESIEEREDRFYEQRPIFTRIITVSYSAFDKFARPKSKHASYVYCGIRNEKGGLSKSHLIETYRTNMEKLRAANRESEWLNYMKRILGEDSSILDNQLDISAGDEDFTEKALSLLSSGQSILANFVTALVAWIQPNSLILFDEPETHLHPNAVASLFGVFNEILEDYKSFSIIATHSPVVIQEIPGKRVIVFRREGNQTTAEPLAVESFGESISELTRHVFETIEIPHHYKKILKDLAEDFSFSEIMALFKGRLSVSAQSYLMTRYKNPK